MAGWRLRAQCTGGRHANLLRCRGLTNSHSYSNSNSYCHTDSHIHRNAYCHGYRDTYTDSNSNSNSYSYGDSHRDSPSSDGNANGDSDWNSKRTAASYSNPEASAYSKAATVVVGRADLSGLVLRLRDEGG